MRIKKVISQHRRDFRAVYECQHCGSEGEGVGYDDAFFHERVIPSMKCSACGKSGNEVTSSPTIPASAVL